jgi:hypothetical protein
MTTENRRSPVRLRHIVVSAATGGLVVGALVLAAPAANAAPIKESTIKSECKDAGGTYGTTIKEGTRFSTCSYKDNEGNGYVD